MWYRAGNPPCTQSQTASQRDTELKTILGYTNPDIFIANELGSSPSNASFLKDFIFNENSDRYLSANYSNNGFSSLTNMLFYDSAKVALLGQDFIDKDLSSNNLVRGIDVYKLYYRDPKLSIGADTVYFTILAAHLKAGSTNNDALDRLDATEAIMEYLENHHNVNNVILAGDFNIQANSEPAFQELVNYSDPSENFFDPINQLGGWNNNANYAPYHTQSTHGSSSGCYSGGGLDDRYDLILISEEIKDGTEKVKYVLNSYQAVGQDGNHFNQSVNSGTNSSVPATIADALYDLSDHLPVRMEIDITKSNIGIDEAEKSLELLRHNNPFDQQLNLFFASNLQEKVEVQILTLTGKVVRKLTLEVGSKEFSINTNTLSKGIYLLNLETDGGENVVKKIIKR